MTTISLPERCDRTAALAIYPELADAMGPKPVPIDASAVAQIGQAMLQVLVSAARSDGGIVIKEPSDAFVEATRLSGLKQLCDPEGAK